MRNLWIIARREYKHYFASPAAYLVAFIMLLIIGIIFYANMLAAFVQQYAPGVQVVIGPMITILLFATPAITMRLLADEQRLGTLELLLTSPVRDWELVVGKWLGGFLFILTIILITWIYPIILNQLITPGIDQGVFLTGYLGIALIASALVAIGVAVSSLFSNQIAVFFATLGVYLVAWLVGMPAQAGGGGSSLLSYLDFSEHFYNTLYRGILDSTDIVFYLSVTAVALLLGTVSIEMRRWR